MVVGNLFVINKGNDFEVTIETTNVEESFENELKPKSLPAEKTSSGQPRNQRTILVDLGRVITRYIVDGYIDKSDRTKLRQAFKFRGAGTCNYMGGDFKGAVEKLTITNSARDDKYYDVKFTIIEGESVIESDTKPGE